MSVFDLTVILCILCIIRKPIGSRKVDKRLDREEMIRIRKAIISESVLRGLPTDENCVRLKDQDTPTDAS